MSQKRWYCGVHNEKITNRRLTHGNNRIPQGLRFYAEKTRKLLIPNTLKNKRNVKEVHPQRLGTSSKTDKNWLRRNIEKKQLPPLPPGTPGDPVFITKIPITPTSSITRLESASMLAQSLSTIIYYKALELRRRYQGRRLLHVQDLSTKPNDTADYVISQRDSAIIPTVSDSSYTSGVLQKHVLYGWSNMYFLHQGAISISDILVCT
ncbi:hypothetical protein RIR_jg7898.t1 [Rhizophagus irregularis DAOM 181602=DAOM 197198]|nr:hypothetical protein RIR_jg7898.t1 [Rhizophagus irregularis DAOM 181602=DAOM 197198]